jgi:hypothetical protein
MIKSIIVLASFIAAVQASCDNACSGHGCCGKQGICECFDNWGLGLSHLSGDCSERICPFELAWVDTPDSLGSYHKYAECANKGICNRASGECECFPGYEGKGCQRTTCPNDCSGHGRCKYIEDLPFGTVAADYYDAISATNRYFAPQDPHTFAYKGWDSYKTRGCECDPGYGDVDCSKRMCEFGTDVMDQRQDLTVTAKYQVQKLTFQADNNVYPYENRDRTFALTFKSKLNETFTTLPINFYSDFGGAGGGDGLHEFVLDVQNGLERLPNRVIDKVNVAAIRTSANLVHVNITFVGEHNQGSQNLLTVRAFGCGDGCTPKLTGLEVEPGDGYVEEQQSSDFNSFECGRRGKCDYTTGMCQCFAGYTGLSCSTVACLV